MSQADELQARTDAFADLSIRFVQGLPDTRVAQRIRPRTDVSVFWLKRPLNATIHSATVELPAWLSEAEQLARIFGASHRTAKKRKRR